MRALCSEDSSSATRDFIRSFTSSSSITLPRSCSLDCLSDSSCSPKEGSMEGESRFAGTRGLCW